MRAVIPSEEQVIQWITSLSNWGRWGEDDQNGCLNLITPEKRKQAAVLVQDGITVSCARPITTEITPDITYQVQRYMVDSGEGRDTDPPERRRVRRGAAEFIGMVCHGQTITHIDALSHYSWQGTIYNGKARQSRHLTGGCPVALDRSRRRQDCHPWGLARHSAGAGRPLASP
jgi:hypothetical protein